MSRIIVLGLFALLMTGFYDVAGAQSAAVGVEPASPTTILIRGIIETVGAAGDAIGKLTEGVRKLIIAGDAGWQTLSVRRTHASLIELSAALTGLAARQRVGAIPALEQYIRQPSATSWPTVTGELSDVLNQVNNVLTQLNKDRSDLVLQPAFAKLQNTLQARASLLSQLQGAAPPLTKAELAELRGLLEKYRVLVAQLEAARDEVNEYARSKKS
jgi:hypothetical protein